MGKAILIFTLFGMCTIFGCQRIEKPIESDAVVQEHQIEATATPEPTQIVEEDNDLVLEGKVIVIDAGHGINNSGKKEPVAPGSSEMKSGFVSGTAGKNLTEEEINLMVAKKLQTALTELGAEVHMTRETHETDMSNVDRAKLGNEVGADLAIRIHADGNNNSSIRGISMLVPSAKYVSGDVYSKSRVAGDIILEEVLATTGAKDRGVVERSDMTGFNWSEVPVILLEMGFMSNPEDDALLETDEYQQKITDGVVNGVLKYFKNNAIS